MQELGEKLKTKPVTVSYSSISTFKECPQKYYFNKEYTTKLQSSAFSFGSSVEDGCMALLQGASLEKATQLFKRNWHTKPANKFEGPKAVFDNDLVFFYKSDLDLDLLTKYDNKLLDKWAKQQKIEDWQDWTEAQLKVMDSGETISNKFFFNRVVWMCARRRGITLIKAFQEQIMPQISEVIAIQKEISIKNADGDKNMGFIDLIVKLKGSDKSVILDLKTAGRYYDAHNINTSDQLRIYAAAEDIKEVGYAVLIKDIKKLRLCDKCGHQRENYRLTKCANCDTGKYTKMAFKANTQLLTKTLDQAAVDDVLNDMSDIVSAIKNKVCWKNPGSCNNFSTKCEYYDACWNGKNPSELPNIKKKGT